MLNLCILQAGPINKDLVVDYPSYDKMFSLLFKNKIEYWNVDVFHVYEDTFPENLIYYNAFIITGSAFGVYENHFWINKHLVLLKKLLSLKFLY